jgi:SAM-dependent methyltransferase
MTQVRDTWQSQLRDELVFWDRYLSTRGHKWPDEFAQRVDPQARLAEEEIVSRITRRQQTVRILDVGSGPMTILGKQLPDRLVEITAVDPLATDYNKLLDRNGIVPPVRTQWCEGECLAKKFKPNSFDFAYSRNALDHAHDPLDVISQMVSVVRGGGWVILRHRPNEAEAAKYKGLHQWNFELRDERYFWIRGHTRSDDVATALRPVARVSAGMSGPWLICAIHKRGPRERRLRRLLGLDRGHLAAPVAGVATG